MTAPAPRGVGRVPNYTTPYTFPLTAVRERQHRASCRRRVERDAGLHHAQQADHQRDQERRPDPESIDSGTACSDKSDNDFDDVRDADDPGCGPNPPPLDPLPPWRIVPKQDGYGLVKGNITEDGNRTYHVPTGEYYERTRIDTSVGERWFCSEDDARAAGWKRAYK
jgi:hypothetical protein